MFKILGKYIFVATRLWCALFETHSTNFQLRGFGLYFIITGTHPSFTCPTQIMCQARDYWILRWYVQVNRFISHAVGFQVSCAWVFPNNLLSFSSKFIALWLKGQKYHFLINISHEENIINKYFTNFLSNMQTFTKFISIYDYLILFTIFHLICVVLPGFTTPWITYYGAALYSSAVMGKTRGKKALGPWMHLIEKSRMPCNP